MLSIFSAVKIIHFTLIKKDQFLLLDKIIMDNLELEQKQQLLFLQK